MPLYDPQKERIDDILFRRKELAKELEKRRKKAEKQQAKLAKAQQDAAKAIWINSTQSATMVRDVIDSIIVTADNRYLKLIEVLPVNFDMMDAASQNSIGDAFAGIMDIIPYRIQIKCFTRRGDVNETLNIMRSNMMETNNPIVREMQEDYLSLVRDTASTIGIKRRYFIILEHDQSTRGDAANLDNITSSLNLYAAMITSRLQDCGNPVLETGDTTFGVNAILYEIMNRAQSEETTFIEHAERVFDSYDTDALSNENVDEFGQKKEAQPPASEFVAPSWMDFTHSTYCVVDGRYYSFYYLDGNRYPNLAYTGWLSLFVDYCEGVDVDLFITREDKDRAQRKISQNQVMNQTKKYTNESVDIYTTMNKVASGSYILEAIAKGEEYFNVSILVTISADNLETLNYRNNSLTKLVRSRQYALRPCAFMEEEAFKSSLPLCQLDRRIERKARRNMMSSGIASLYPFLSFELQDPNGIVLGVNTRNNSVVSVDNFNSSRHANANVVMMGSTGFGKTTTAQIFAVRYFLQGIQSYIITPLKGEQDYKRTCERIGGMYLYLGPGTTVSINICDIVPPDKSAQVEEIQKSWLNQKISTLHGFFSLICPDITMEEDRQLDKFFYEAYAEKGITDENESVFIPGTDVVKQMPVLGDIHRLISYDPDMKRIYNLMTPYVSGAHKEFNQQTNVDLNNLYIAFDMGGMNGQDLFVSMYVVIDYVWNRVREDITKKKAIFFDELWKLISVEGNEMAGAYCLEIFRTIRAYGGSAICMTQEVADFVNFKNGIYGKGIIGNADTKICLHLNKEEVKVLRNFFEMTDKEAEAISDYKRGTGLLMTGNSRVEVNFKLSEKELLTINTDPSVARKEKEAAEKRKQALLKMKTQKGNQQ